jgi:hypothetical protein
VSRPEYLLVSLALVRAYFVLDLFGEIFAQESSTFSIEVFEARLHDSLCSAKGTVSFIFARHLYEASAAEHVLAVQSHRPVRNGEADGTEIVIQLWNNGNKFGGHFNIKVSHHPSEQSLQGLMLPRLGNVGRRVI